MTVVLHISDLHLGTEQAPVVSGLRELAREQRPDLLILSGDITQRARTVQFERAAELVRELGAPHLVAIPGNHDVPLFDLPTRLLSPYAGYRRFFGDELEPHFESNDCLVLSVKTTRRYRHVDGEISPAQRERIAARLRSATSQQLRLVVLHQPIAVPRPSEEHNVVNGRDLAMPLWAEAGADLVLSGHIHLPFVLPLHESFALPRPLWAVSAGTAISSRIRHEAGNSLNIIRTTATPRSSIVEQWDYDSTSQCFSRVREHRLG